MEPLTSSQIKKVKKRWAQREQFIDRLMKTAQVSPDAVPFMTIDAELIALFDYPHRTVTTFFKNKSSIELSYECFETIMKCNINALLFYHKGVKTVRSNCILF